ncbi:hypothetical protein BS47DRAFT_1259427, partial [Hydnum rufescens UP504]
ADSTEPQVVHAIQALLDYIYMAQYLLQSEDMLHEMAGLLNIFHNNKDVFIANDACGNMEHLNIPKLYALPCSINNACCNGVSINFTTETAEYLHTPMCKDLYNATNCHQYEIQMLWLLDMNKRIYLCSSYMGW